MYKVIVVEDNKAILRNLSSLVEEMTPKFELVFAAGNGKKALEFIEQNEEIDILLTDIRMPMMDGLELIAAVKKKRKNIEYIVISGYDEFEYARKAISLGVTEYLLKPVMAGDLQEALEKTAKSIRQKKEELHVLHQWEKEKMGDLCVTHSETIIDKEYKNLIKKLMPELIKWKETDLLEKIGETLDEWYEKAYSMENIRVLLLSVTEMILRQKGYLGKFNMSQPVDNIIRISENYYQMRQTALEFYKALYQKINALNLEKNCSSENLYQKIKDYLEAHIYENLSIGDLAEHFHVSASYINRIFKKNGSDSPIAYYNQRKIDEACRLLKNEENCKIKDISDALGYQNQHYFSKAFKQITGVSPVEYREQR